MIVFQDDRTFVGAGYFFNSFDMICSAADIHSVSVQRVKKV